jgi:hypothetical protein
MVAATLQGKDTARGHLLALMTRVLSPDPENESSHSDLSPEEQEIVKAAVARIKSTNKS